jgi:spore germination protein KC
MRTVEKNKGNLIITIYLLAISIILSSCTGGREIQELGIVTSIGMDIEDDKVIVTCEVINTTSGNTQSGSSTHSPKEVVFIQGEGITVFEAIRGTTLNFDRKLFFSHVNTIILGEEFAKKGIAEFLDLVLRDNEPRENMYILVAKGTKAYDVMGIKGDLSQSAGNYLHDVLEDSRYNGKSLNITVAEYYRYYYEASNEPVIGIVQKKEKRVIDEERKKIEPTKLILDVGGGAVTKRDTLIGYFTPDEMFGYNFIVDYIKGGLIVFNTPKELSENKPIIGSEGKFTVVEILKSKTKKNVTITDGKIHLNINVKVRGALAEENKAIDISNMEVIDVLERASSEEVKKLISKTLNKGQKEFQQDNFSIGELVHHKYPKVWKKISKDWNNIFSEITYNINVETEIVKTGIINVPSNLRKRR